MKAHIDRSVAGLDACRASLIPGELGWFGLWPPSASNPCLQLDEIEYVLAKSLAFDAPISIETSLANLAAHPLTGPILEMIRTYEDLRMRRAVGAGVRRMLEERGAEFALLRSTADRPQSSGRWRGERSCASRSRAPWSWRRRRPRGSRRRPPSNPPRAARIRTNRSD